MAGIPEPVLVAGIRALPKGLKANLRRHLQLGTPIAIGHHQDYVLPSGAACLAFLAAYEDPPRPVRFREEIPEPAAHAYGIMWRAAGGVALFVGAEMEASEEDIIASIEEGTR